LPKKRQLYFSKKRRAVPRSLRTLRIVWPFTSKKIASSRLAGFAA
jgi:hypothetical protein